MTHQQVRAGLVAVMLALAGPTLAAPIDPDCSVAKAARGAATKAVVGVRAIVAMPRRPRATRSVSMTRTVSMTGTVLVTGTVSMTATETEMTMMVF
jgi:hypothetical protein